MIKKISALLIALLILMSFAVIPAFAEDESDSTGSEAEATSSDVASTATSEPTPSTAPVASKSGGITPNSGQKFIPDDSEYYTGSIGGDVSVIEVVSVESASSSEATSSTTVPGGGKISNTIKRWIWLPIGIIALCILILLYYNFMYKLKYEAIDPAAKRKAAKKKDARRAKMNGERDSSHHPRD